MPHRKWSPSVCGKQSNLIWIKKAAALPLLFDISEETGDKNFQPDENENTAAQNAGFACQRAWGSSYVDVAKLIDTYRQTVNPRVNVFSVQTAGYDNVLIPENGYRTSILYGWTGNEVVYADAINRFWDEMDERAEG